MQGNELAKRLQADDKAGKVPKPLYNHYTVITSDESHNYSQVANATFFPEIAAIVTRFDDWIAGVFCASFCMQGRLSRDLVPYKSTSPHMSPQNLEQR